MAQTNISKQIINIKGHKLTAEIINEIKLKSQNAEELKLVMCEIPNELAEILRDLKKLKTFIIRQCEINDKMLKTIIDRIGGNNFELIDFGDNLIGENNCQLFEEILSKCKLKSKRLILDGNPCVNYYLNADIQFPFFNNFADIDWIPKRNDYAAFLSEIPEDLFPEQSIKTASSFERHPQFWHWVDDTGKFNRFDGNVERELIHEFILKRLVFDFLINGEKYQIKANEPYPLQAEMIDKFGKKRILKYC